MHAIAADGERQLALQSYRIESSASGAVANVALGQIQAHRAVGQSAQMAQRVGGTQEVVAGLIAERAGGEAAALQAIRERTGLAQGGDWVEIEVVDSVADGAGSQTGTSEAF